MSRYATKSELIDMIKRTAATDYNKLGTPLGIESFNVAGLIRDCKITGDGQYGWTMGVHGDEFKEAIIRNVRPVALVADARAYDVQMGRAEAGVNDWNRAIDVAVSKVAALDAEVSELAAVCAGFLAREAEEVAAFEHHTDRLAAAIAVRAVWREIDAAAHRGLYLHNREVAGS